MKIFNNLKKLKRKKDDEKMFFYENSQKWLKQKKITVKESTYLLYTCLIDTYILPTFENFTIDDLKEYDFNEYVENLMEKLSPKTIEDVIRILKAILRYIEDEYDCNLKVKRIFTPKVENEKLVTLCKREISRIGNYCMKVNSLKSLGIVICLNTGLRVGEICALKWKNINLERGIIYVESTLQRVSDKELGRTKIIIDTPKTVNSRREIPISTKLYNILKPLKKQYKPEAFFLTGDVQKFVEPRNYQREFKKILKKCRIKSYKFHILRHTFATECVKVGMDIKSLSEILGHSSVEITLDRYVHPTYKDKKKYLEKL